ncbi:MAG: MFS transporter [Bacteroidetes bacterium]|jgi:NNP family nitrate/nitrite transporter-like MFS transporter|nr:MFS transporter [Bacteroidota bacterium]
MEVIVSGKSHRMLFLNTLAFTVCFAVWLFNGVMVTFLVDKGVFNWGPVEIGWLLGIPILTGSIFRLPMGMLTDKFGGKWVFGILLLFCSIPMYFLGSANSFWQFALLSFGYGMAGTAFAVGIAFTSVWYPRKWQGTALGIFGAGNAGAAITTLLAPTILAKLTHNGIDIDQWRTLPKIYAVALLSMAIIFLLFAVNKKPENQGKNFKQMLLPLKSVRVWRFGLDYFLVFGCFVAFSQWLVPYFVNVYEASLVTAGLFASIFSLPSGLIRALGGFLSDKMGARRVMRIVFITTIAISALLIIPKMEIQSPGKGIQAAKSGTITFSSDSLIRVGTKDYQLEQIKTTSDNFEKTFSILPAKDSWQTPVVKVGDSVIKKQLLAEGTTRIHFQANMWVYAILVMFIGIAWGIGKAGVYKFIPDYFPNDIGVVGGMVGVIGGLGGFFCPIIFGYLLEWTGLWTSCWMFILFLALICFIWKKRVVRSIDQDIDPIVVDDID